MFSFKQFFTEAKTKTKLVDTQFRFLYINLTKRNQILAILKANNEKFNNSQWDIRVIWNGKEKIFYMWAGWDTHDDIKQKYNIKTQKSLFGNYHHHKNQINLRHVYDTPNYDDLLNTFEEYITNNKLRITLEIDS